VLLERESPTWPTSGTLLEARHDRRAANHAARAAVGQQLGSAAEHAEE